MSHLANVPKTGHVAMCPCGHLVMARWPNKVLSKLLLLLSDGQMVKENGHARTRANGTWPQPRQARLAATIRANDGDNAQWWKVLAFSETVQSELMRLTDGDALSMQGALCGKSG